MSSVFGVPVDGRALPEALTAVKTTEKPLWIVTANPEILLFAKRHETYRSTLKQSDMVLVDGFGLWLMLRLFEKKTTRVTGVECAEGLLQLAQQENWRVALFGGSPGSAEGSLADIKRAYPNLNIVAEQAGTISSMGENDPATDEACLRLTFFDPQVLLVALGHPKQEEWIKAHIQEFPNLKAIVGVGGTFDFWSGKIKRAPGWMRSLGLEWLWRLIQEPKRIKRILNAVIVFPIAFIQDRLKPSTDR